MFQFLHRNIFAKISLSLFIVTLALPYFYFFSKKINLNLILISTVSFFSFLFLYFRNKMQIKNKVENDLKEKNDLLSKIEYFNLRLNNRKRELIKSNFLIISMIVSFTGSFAGGASGNWFFSIIIGPIVFLGFLVFTIFLVILIRQIGNLLKEIDIFFKNETVINTKNEKELASLEALRKRYIHTYYIKQISNLVLSIIIIFTILKLIFN